MTHEEMIELARRAEAGERVVIRCENDDEAMHVQAGIESRLSFGPVSRRSGVLMLRGGGALIFQSARRSMKQVQMLQEAVTKALSGERVLVTTTNQRAAEDLKIAARASIPDVRVKQETADRVLLLGGGDLRFRAFSKAEDQLKGFMGEVYIVQESGDEWDRGTIPYVPDPPPRTRLERVDDE